MAKLHEDMMFFDKIANHPDLQKNLLVFGEDEKSQIFIDNSLEEIGEAALDGFLRVRKSFWEASESPVTKDHKKKVEKRSKSDSGRCGVEVELINKILKDSHT